MKFAFMLMGPYDPTKDDVLFQDGSTRMIGVPDIGTAERIAAELRSQGYKELSSFEVLSEKMVQGA